MKASLALLVRLFCLYPFHPQIFCYICNSYLYGFNGYEKDNELKGEGNSIDFGARIYDSRIAKFLSIDPLASKYPYWSPYQYAGNSPISIKDLMGLGPGETIQDNNSIVEGKEIDLPVSPSLFLMEKNKFSSNSDPIQCNSSQSCPISEPQGHFYTDMGVYEKLKSFYELNKTDPPGDWCANSALGGISTVFGVDSDLESIKDEYDLYDYLTKMGKPSENAFGVSVATESYFKWATKLKEMGYLQSYTYTVYENTIDNVDSWLTLENEGRVGVQMLAIGQCIHGVLIISTDEKFIFADQNGYQEMGVEGIKTKILYYMDWAKRDYSTKRASGKVYMSDTKTIFYRFYFKNK